MKMTLTVAAFVAAALSHGGPAAAETSGGETLIAGTVVQAQIDQQLSSKTNHDGDTFTLTPTKGNFFFKNPSMGGCVFAGHVENVTPAGPTRKATMNAILDGVKCPGEAQDQPMKVQLLSVKEFEPHSHMMRDTALVVGGAVAGHYASAKTGTKGGTLAGAAGGVALASTMKSDVVIKKGTVLKLKLKEPMHVPASGA